MTGQEPLTPVEQALRTRKRTKVVVLCGLLLLLSAYVFWRIVPSPPEDHTDIEAHFKYGSIGADNTERGLPYWVWKVLPEMFPAYVPQAGHGGYAAFGMLVEPGKDRPIGFSQRRVLGLQFVGLNCAICHASTLRETPESPPQIILGMPATTVNLEGFFRFLFACVADGRFTADNVLQHIEQKTRLGFIGKLIYRQVIYRFREAVLAQRQQLAYLNRIPDFGPGRVDTFGPYKVLFFGLPIGDAVGTADFPSLWNQQPRQGMQLHWDGNNASLDERNISASIGAGVTPTALDMPRLQRVAAWVRQLPPPRYPAARIDQRLAETGQALYAQHCAACHAFDGAQVGKVVPIEHIGTDANRLDSFTQELAAQMNTLGTGYRWKFNHFKKTEGYANAPLDGVWLRAPYLHNGSVPTLWDLLEQPEHRPKKFYRGYDVYDWQKVGFVSHVAAEPGRTFFEFDTNLQGNGNGGHVYGTHLSRAEKDALIEYLKTL